MPRIPGLRGVRGLREMRKTESRAEPRDAPPGHRRERWNPSAMSCSWPSPGQLPAAELPPLRRVRPSASLGAIVNEGRRPLSMKESSFGRWTAESSLFFHDQPQRGRLPYRHAPAGPAGSSLRSKTSERGSSLLVAQPRRGVRVGRVESSSIDPHEDQLEAVNGQPGVGIDASDRKTGLGDDRRFLTQ